MCIVHATSHSHYKHLAPRKVRRKATLKTTTHYNVYTNTSHLYIVTSATMQSNCHTLSQASVFVLQMSGRLWGVWLCVAFTRGDHCHTARSTGVLTHSVPSYNANVGNIFKWHKKSVATTWCLYPLTMTAMFATMAISASAEASETPFRDADNQVQGINTVVLTFSTGI